MNQAVNISKRLKLIADCLPPGTHFVDIGSDHAYLPCYVCQKDTKARVIAGELNKGPFKSAQRTVKRCGIAHAITVRLGNGFEVVNPGEVDTVVIAGMGGSLISSILKAGSDKLQGIKRVIVQPNVEARMVRKTLSEFGFAIKHEDIIEEHGHIYEMIVADQVRQTVCPDEKSLLFGPVLMEKKSSVFLMKWEYEKMKLERVINQMELATEPDMDKIQTFKKEISWIEEVLQDG